MVQLTSMRTLALVGIALLLIVVALWYIRRRYKRSDKSGNEETGEQRQQVYREERDRSIPLRTQAMRTPIEAKIIGVMAVGIAVFVGYNIYAYLKTGSPTQIAVATETKFIVGAMSTFVVGMGYERRRRAKSEGKMDVTFEANPAENREEHTKTYYYDPRDVEETSNGPVIFERNRKRWLKLFRMPKLHGKDKRFRDVEDPRPPEDKVGIAIPSHARKVSDNHWEVRTKGRVVLESANGAADIMLLPPDNMSREQRMQRATDIDNLQTEVKELRARNAELESTQRSRREEDKNEIDRILGNMERVITQMRKMMPDSRSVTIQEEQGSSRSSRQDGERKESVAVGSPEDSNGRRGGQ
jgi:hypothetical protein